MVACVAVAVILLLRSNACLGRQTVLVYLRGILWRGGKLLKVLDPGCYQFRPTSEQITVVDLRSQPLIVERLAYPDGAGESAWVSVSAAVRVVDVRRATEHCSDHVKEAMAMIRDVLRRTLSSRRASEVRRNRHGCEQELNTQLASELEKI